MATKELEVIGKMKFDEVPSEEEVNSVVGELEAMVTERVKTAREYTLMVSWEAGKILRDNEQDFKVNIRKLVELAAEDERMRHQHMSNTKLWQCLTIYDHHPAFESLYDTEHGQNVTVTKLVAMYWPPKPKKEPRLEDVAMSIFNKYGPDKTAKLVKALQKLLEK